MLTNFLAILIIQLTADLYPHIYVITTSDTKTGYSSQQAAVLLIFKTGSSFYKW